MATIQQMFMNELIRLQDDYDRCTDERIKREIHKDIELLKGVIFGDKMSSKKEESSNSKKELLQKVTREFGG